MLTVRIGRGRATGLSIALVVSMIAGVAQLGAAQTTQAGLTAVEFDEIDHVYTTEAVPAPGSFQQDAAHVAQTAAPQAPKKNRILGALNAASNALGGAGSVAVSSGEIGRALRISDAAAQLVPIATAMGLAGGRRFDTLLQTYVLPRVSPTGSLMLAGFLSAQADYKSRFPSAQTGAPQATPPPQLEPYAKGVLRHYTVASNGWVRIDDPNTKTIVIIKPDVGKSYTIDTGAQTMRIADYTRATPQTGTPSPARSGTASFDDRVDSLGQTTLEGISAVGYRTRSTVHVAGAGNGCPDTTITSTRVEYFAHFHSPADAANVMQGPPNGDAAACEPKTAVKHTGSKVPTDLLALYQANTIDKRTAAGTDHYTVVIERGNFRAQDNATPATFDVPPNVRQVAAGQP
jgi:hypothetical protein